MKTLEERLSELEKYGGEQLVKIWKEIVNTNEQISELYEGVNDNLRYHIESKKHINSIYELIDNLEKEIKELKNARD